MSIYTHRSEPVNFKEMPLHEILALAEGPQTEALMEFYANTDPNSDSVNIRTASGKQMVTYINGQKYVIPAGRGRSVSRRLAVRLLLDYGRNGKYWARERNTGIRKIDLPRVPEETRERIQWYTPEVDFKNFNPSEDYLIHHQNSELTEELEEELELTTTQE
jgi:hypothetical protein